ncbi:MAG TPA: DUF4304 domain-containing protein [Phycisphaerales bacterium]|nr:DUF4304 domain-containing protein [Phycisphaerales bacterium]
MNADEAFKELTRRTGVLLRQHGFKGSGQNFKRDCGEQWQGINFQKSQWRENKSQPIEFYLNIHVYFPTVQRERLSTAASFDDYKFPNCDLQLRAGDLIADKDDSWLKVSGPLPRLDNFCQRFMSLLSDTILPAMDTMRTPEGLERTLRRVPWMCMSANRWLLQHGRSIHAWDAGESADWTQDAAGLWWHSSERAAP